MINYKAGRKFDIPYSQIVFDASIYPRIEVSENNVSILANKLRLGVQLDPIVLEEGTFRIVDGVSRWHSHVMVHGSNSVMAVVTFSYPSENDLKKHSAFLNMLHGLRLTKQDQTMVVKKLSDSGVSDDELSETLQLTRHQIEDLKIRWAKTYASEPVENPPGDELSHPAVDEQGKIVYLKHGAKHLSGQTMTAKQVEAHDRMLGGAQVFVVNQVIGLIEGDMMDKTNLHFFKRLRYLAALINDREASWPRGEE